MCNPLKIIVPYKFKARSYQQNIFKQVGSDIHKLKRGVAVWHRRSGKDKTFLNFDIREMHYRIGAYYYIFPTLTQGRKIIWDGIDRDGFKFMDHFPREMVQSKNKSDMQVKLKNGSIFQIVGTDHLDSIIGTNPVGVIFSEYSLQNPIAWDFIRPILSENGGWALFNYTFRGKNHGWDLYEMARQNDKWYCELLTVTDTKREDGTPVISSEAIDEERQAGMDEDLINQEYYCDPSATDKGAFYSDQLKWIDENNRVREVNYEPDLLVMTFWDIGRTDYNSIWFTQKAGEEIRIIDFYQNHNKGIDHYIDFILGEKNTDGRRVGGLPYKKYKHWAPHDIKVTEYTSNQSRIEYARLNGVDFNVVPDISIQDGIDAGRRVLKYCYFDNKIGKRTSDNGEHGVNFGLNALRSYRKLFDEKRKTYKDIPHHDWASHPADAFRYLSIGIAVSYGVPGVRIQAF